MTWNCINCEAANDYSRTSCEVCAYERYFSIREVNDLIKSQGDEPGDFKKIQSNYKRINTVNKKIRQENKELMDKLAELQEFHDHYSHDMKTLQENLLALQKSNLRLKIWLTVAGLVVLFFVLAKVTVHVNF